jgi:ABC-type transport system substrate-binding protein
VGSIHEPSTVNILQCCVRDHQQMLGYDQLAATDALGQPIPAFAESWSVSGDGLTWTFKIRPGMTWSDGDPDLFVVDDGRFAGEDLRFVRDDSGRVVRLIEGSEPLLRTDAVPQ